MTKPPEEAQRQIGRIEVSHRAWRYMARRVIDELQLAGEDDIWHLCTVVSQAKNAMIRTAGCSAYQWTFGKDPAVPDSLLNREGNEAVHSATTSDEQFRLRSRIRAAASHALIEYDTSESLRRSVLRQSRPYRGEFKAGDKVAFWREARTRKNRRIPARYIVATVIGPAGAGGVDDPNIWVSSSGHPICVSKEQLRMAYGTELWTPSAEDLQELCELARKEPRRFFDERLDRQDESTEPPQDATTEPPMTTYGAALDEEEKDLFALPEVEGAASASSTPSQT